MARLPTRLFALRGRDRFLASISLDKALVRLLLAMALGLPIAACGAESVTVTTQAGSYRFAVEIADTPDERAKGLMFREDLAPDRGMLFDFHEERPVSFWMRNTFIPLDMIFIEADGDVLKVHANAIPHDPTSISSDGPVRYVLEIPGGRAAEIGLKPGDRVTGAALAD